MLLASPNRPMNVLRMAIASFVTVAAPAIAGEVLNLTSADGVQIETNRLTPSTRFVGAASVWIYRSYAMAIDCSPPAPRACHANSQVTNYHFNCAPRYIVVAERLAMDINGNVVNHQVLEPYATYGLNLDADNGMLATFCGPLPNLEDLMERRRDALEQSREALERSRSEKPPPKGK